MVLTSGFPTTLAGPLHIALFLPLKLKPRSMKVATDKKTSRALVRLPNCALVQVLKATVARLHDLELEVNELEFALDEDQKEVESYTHELDECRHRMKDIDEFVRALRAGELPAIPDAASALADMVEEREEDERAVKRYEEACGWHERQFQKLQGQCSVLKKERITHHKTCIEICSIFRHNGVFELVRRRLARLNAKSLGDRLDMLEVFWKVSSLAG